MKTDTVSHWIPVINWFRNARFLSVSLVFHLIMAALLGGVVLFKAVQETESFVGAGSQFLASGDESGEQAQEDPVEFIEPSASSSEETEPAAALQASAVAALSNTVSTFEIADFSPVQTMGASLTGSKLGAVTGNGRGTGAAPGAGGGRGAIGSRSFFGVPAVEGSRGLTGVFYDLKQNEKREPTGMEPWKHGQVVVDFIDGWKERKLSHFFKAPQSLVTTQIFMPNMSADLGPRAFGVEKDVKPSMWLALYKGSVSPPRTGTYHFVGAGDDILCVRFNGKLVLDGSWKLPAEVLKAEAHYQYGFSGNPNGCAKGIAVRVQQGRFYDIEILIGEQPGGLFCATLLVEEEGVNYDKDAQGNPILPVFRIANTETPPLEPGQSLPPYLKDGPVWSAR